MIHSNGLGDLARLSGFVRWVGAKAAGQAILRYRTDHHGEIRARAHHVQFLERSTALSALGNAK